MHELRLGKRERQELTRPLDRANVFAWNRTYCDNGILDGTQWSLDVFFENGYVFPCYGSNEYPDGYEALFKGLSELVIGRGLLERVSKRRQ